MFNSNYGSISHRILHIWYLKILQPWNPGQRSLKVIETGTIRYPAYGFIWVSYSNFGASLHRFYTEQRHTNLVHPKDSRSTDGTAECVYEIELPCYNCNISYIGETCKNSGKGRRNTRRKRDHQYPNEVYAEGERRVAKNKVLCLVVYIEFIPCNTKHLRKPEKIIYTYRYYSY